MHSFGAMFDANFTLRRLLLIVAPLLAVLLWTLAASGATPVRAAAGEVVMLSTSDTGFGAGRIVTAFNSAGKVVVTKTPVEWAAMTAADFDLYDAVVLADPTCQGSSYVSNDATGIGEAVNNASIWWKDQRKDQWTDQLTD